MDFSSNLRRLGVTSVYNQSVAAAERLPRNGDLEGERRSCTGPHSGAVQCAEEEERAVMGLRGSRAPTHGGGRLEAEEER